MTISDKGIFGEDKSRNSLKEFIVHYASYWYVFLITLLLCIGAGIFYIYYTPPKYIATTAIMVKGGESNNSKDVGDLLESTLKVTRDVNLDNEIMLFSAASLMQQTVKKYDFNITYFIQGRLVKSEVYGYTPYTLHVYNAGDSSSFQLRPVQYNNAGGVCEYVSLNQKQTLPFKWNDTIKIKGRSLTLNLIQKGAKGIDAFTAQWAPPADVASELLEDLSVTAHDDKTSVLELSIKTRNLEKGKEILNALYAEFYANDIEDRSKLSATTVDFIDDRLLKITKELKNVEGDIEVYQGSNELSDIKGQLSQSLENSSAVTKTIKDIGIQQGVVTMILDYFEKPGKSSKLVPSSIGLNDATLASLIAQYNELQLKKEREAPLVAPNSTVMQDLNTQLSNIKGSILESLTSINKNLQLQQNSFNQQSSQYRNFLSSVPHSERVMQEIKRKQSITEGLYLYLLQKREEAAISSTSSKVAHYRQIDPASGYGPVEPNKRNIIIYATLLGLFLAFGIIQLKDILNDKIQSREEIGKKVSAPVTGEINHVSSGKKKVIEVIGRSLVSEQFRTLRTNLSFLLKQEKAKTIIVTSSVSGDGKSFVSLNLAAVCAIPGKKTALLEFDIRNPIINDQLYVDNTKGLTDFINGSINEPSQLARLVHEIPDLHIYPCGPVPENPADMLLSDRIPLIFDWLKKNYDYIIIDAAPVGLVSDPIILAKFADLVLYIVRQQRTKKKDLEFIQDTITAKTLNNVYIVLNDIKSNDKAKYANYYGYIKS